MKKEYGHGRRNECFQKKSKLVLSAITLKASKHVKFWQQLKMIEKTKVITVEGKIKVENNNSNYVEAS